MKVKINDIWYNGDEQPICIELTEQDKINISNMHKDCNKYCEYPSDKNYNKKDILEWMNK